MEPDRRRETRVAFGGLAEISVVEPAQHIVGSATNLSKFGCFIKTTGSVPERCNVNVRIIYKGKEFTVPGKVMYALADDGVGVAFGTVSSKDQTVLDDWLSKPD